MHKKKTSLPTSPNDNNNDLITFCQKYNYVLVYKLKLNSC